jgi:hypothetical protein
MVAFAVPHAKVLVHTAGMDGPPAPPTTPTPVPVPIKPSGPPPAADAGGLHIGPWPFGIVAVVALRLFDAIGLILVGLDRPGLPIGDLPLIGSSTPVTRAADLVGGILVLAGIVGLLLFKRWGWILTMVLVGVSLVGDLIRVAIGDPQYVGLLLHVLAAFYLNARSVRALAHEDLDHDGAQQP